MKDSMKADFNAVPIKVVTATDSTPQVRCMHGISRCEARHRGCLSDGF